MDDDRDLIERLRRYESRVPVESGRSVRSRGGVRWAALAGAAVAFVALAVIGLSLLPREVAAPVESPSPSPAPPSASAPDPTPSAIPSVTATPSPSAAPSGPSAPDIRWERADWPADRSTPWLAHDAGLDLWFANGPRAIWTSTDRVSWQAATVESAGCEGEDAPCDWSVSGVVRLGERLVAVGLMNDRSSDGTAVASWVSEDGTVWSLTSSGLAGGGQAASVAATDDAVLLLAAGLTSPEAGTTRHVSTDGETWEPIPGPEGIRLLDVHGDRDGFVAVGVEWTFDGTDYASRPIVQASPDGRTWSTTTLGEPGSGVLTAVTRLASGAYVAAGRDEAGVIFTMRSEGDDEPWTVARPGQTALPEGFDPGTGVTLASTQAGVVLGGIDEAWTSPDGATWNEASAPDEFMFMAMATDGADVAAAGFSPSERPVSWSLWAGDVVSPN